MNRHRSAIDKQLRSKWLF